MKKINVKLKFDTWYHLIINPFYFVTTDDHQIFIDVKSSLENLI